MTIHDIGITEMQQQDIDTVNNLGDIAYNIKVHGIKKAKKEVHEDEEGEKSEEEEIEYNPLTVADLEKIDSEGNYNLVFKLVKEDLAKDND